MLCKQHIHGRWQLASMAGPRPLGRSLPSCLFFQPWEKSLSGQAVGEAQVPAPAPVIPAPCARSIYYPPISSHHVNHSELKRRSIPGNGWSLPGFTVRLGERAGTWNKAPAGEVLKSPDWNLKCVF